MSPAAGAERAGLVPPDMSSTAITPPPEEHLVDWAELEQIELVVRTRMKEHTAGVHASVFHGDGFDYVGLRDWQPGDRPAVIDWAQSSITNFSPLVTREFEPDRTASITIVADISRSTRCGTGGTSIARVIARAVATLALAGTFFQDRVGLATFDGAAWTLRLRPRVGRAHALHCLEAYQTDVRAAVGLTGPPRRRRGLAALLRRQSVVPVISDFLFEDAVARIDELAQVASVHDVFVVMVDATFAFALPPLSSGWIEVADADTGRTRLLSAREAARLGEDVREWQDRVAHAAERRGLEVVTLAPGQEYSALADFLGKRRLRTR